MNIEDLTIKQARELSEIFTGSPGTCPHPLVGKKVLALLPGRFIYIGTLEQVRGHYVIRDAQNIRYWKSRENGLGGFAAKGPIDGDILDDCPPIWPAIGQLIALMEVTYE